jgi:hypothetical protein
LGDIEAFFSARIAIGIKMRKLILLLAALIFRKVAEFPRR